MPPCIRSWVRTWNAFNATRKRSRVEAAYPGLTWLPREVGNCVRNCLLCKVAVPWLMRIPVTGLLFRICGTITTNPKNTATVNSGESTDRGRFMSAEIDA